MKLNDFICVRCGECCRHIDQVEELKHLQINGVCKYLVGDLCSIYDSRPDLCRRDKVYEMFRDTMSEDDFMELFVKYCDFFRGVKKANDG